MPMNDTDGFDDRISVRAWSNYKEDLEDARKKHPEKYANESHQIRAYIIKGLREDGVNV